MDYKTIGQSSLTLSTNSFFNFYLCLGSLANSIKGIVTFKFDITLVKSRLISEVVLTEGFSTFDSLMAPMFCP
jgi:hypothetical protein